MTNENILHCALEAGIAVSTQYGQGANKLMPTSDRATLVKFVKLLSKDIREAVANYIRSEGCNCCEGEEHQTKDRKVLAELLGVPMYDDKSGYNFSKFQTKE